MKTQLSQLLRKMMLKMKLLCVKNYGGTKSFHSGPCWPWCYGTVFTVLRPNDVTTRINFFSVSFPIPVIMGMLATRPTWEMATYSCLTFMEPLWKWQSSFQSLFFLMLSEGDGLSSPCFWQQWHLLSSTFIHHKVIHISTRKVGGEIFSTSLESRENITFYCFCLSTMSGLL